MAAWLALLLCFVYLLSYAGVLHAVDEQSALSVTETFLLGQGWHVNQMEWDQARTPPQNIAGVDGNLYSKKGIGVSLLALLPLWLGKQIAGVGAVRLALLAALPVTVLAVLAFFGAGLALGYARATALLGALALGLATPLWPYARTLFSEALAACGLALALWGMIAFRRTAAPKTGTPWLWLASAGLAVLTLAKSSNAVAVAVFGVYLIYVWLGERRRQLTLRGWLAQVAAFGVPLGLAVLVTVGYNYVRFHTLFGFPLEPEEQFNTPLWLGLAGLLFSPGKGIFWYMPLLWLAPFFVGRWRVARRLPDFLLALGAAAAIILLYATWFDWPGGRSWGPRMIVPAVPALALLVYPAFSWLLGAPRWSAGRIAGWGVLAWSCAVQLPGVLVNFERQEMLDMQAGATVDGLLWQPALAPWLTYWMRLGTAAMDPWWAQAYLATLPAWLPAALAGLLVLAGGGDRAWPACGCGGRNGRASGWAPASLLVAGAAALILVAATPDPRWDERSAVREENAALLEFVARTRRRATWCCWTWWPAPTSRGAPGCGSTVGVCGHISAGSARRTWPAPTASGCGSGCSRTGGCGWRSRPPARGTPARPPSAGWTAGPFPAAGAGSAASATPSTCCRRRRRRRTGSQARSCLATLPRWRPMRSTRDAATPGYLVELAWAVPLPDDVRYSVQALDAGGRLVAQVDGAPGRLETTAGRLDRIGLAVPPGVPVSVILKLYRAADGVPLPVTPPGASGPQEFLPLQTVAAAG